MIKRKLFRELKEHLGKKEILLLTGPRQTGKTFLMLLLQDYLRERGKKTLFLNLDIETDKQFFVSQEKLLSKIKLEIGNEGFVFIDEIQRKEDAGVFLKGIYDMGLPYKFIVSGSGSIELKEKIHESLMGRKRAFELLPVSFDEFVNFRTQYAYEDKLDSFYVLEQRKTQEFFEEYLNFGGYPRVILEKTLFEKKKVINEIYQTYLEKDIAYLLKIRKTDDFGKLVKIMASQIGNLVNYTELSSTLGISLKTIKNYLWYLQKTFILRRVSPFFRNVRKEITKSPLFYFVDLGFRNYALDIFGNMEIHNPGFLFQNFIHNLFYEIIQSRAEAGKIHFWKTKGGAEVDIILDSGREQIPIEIKYTLSQKFPLTRSLKNFIEKYHPSRAYVINPALENHFIHQKTNIAILPFFRINQIFEET